MGVTDTVVEYIRSTTFDDLPSDVVEAAKFLTLDTLGALYAAWPTRHPAPRLLGDYVRDMGGLPECTIFGRDFKAPAANAGLVHGTMGYAADLEGGILSPPPVHMAASGVPTGLTIAERQAASGKSYITALVLGYDIADRVSKASLTQHSYPHSFHPSAIFGTFGSTAIAGKLLQLDHNTLCNAIGLAGNNASGLMAWVTDVTEHSRPLNNGRAAFTAITSALLAERGYGGPPDILANNKYNIYDAYSGESDVSQLTRDLGTDYAILRHDGFKKYPCCYDIHTGLDALLDILSRHSLAASDIDKISHTVSANRRQVIDNNILRSHNAQYIMAVAAIEGTVKWDDFLTDRRNEPAIAAMYNRVDLHGSDALAKSDFHEPAIVEITTKDGQIYTRQVDLPRGHLKNPISDDQLRDKFTHNARSAVGDRRASEMESMVGALDHQSSMVHLVSELAVKD